MHRCMFSSDLKGSRHETSGSDGGDLTNNAQYKPVSRAKFFAIAPDPTRLLKQVGLQQKTVTIVTDGGVQL